MYYQLSKSQKKIARAVMDKGLDIHYGRSLREAESVIFNWNKGKFKDNREAYMKLYECVIKNDRHIGTIYNGKGGSRWVEIMVLQLADGVITLDDLKDFDEDVRNTIIQWNRI